MGKRPPGLIYVDGKIMSYDVIKKNFKVGFSTISRTVLQKGRDLTADDFGGYKIPQNIVPEPVKYDHKDHSPGWLERREFPNAGKNGFDCFGKSDTLTSNYFGLPAAVKND